MRVRLAADREAQRIRSQQRGAPGGEEAGESRIGCGLAEEVTA
jgi:hypothetical protein